MDSNAMSLESLCKAIHDSSSSLSLLKQNWVNTRAVITLTQVERMKVRETYVRIYGEDLINVDQGSPLSLMMLINPFERDAAVARRALLHHNVDCNYKTLVEIYTCRKSSHVLLIQQAYHARFRSHLDQDIAGMEPPHPLQKILLALSASHKAHHAETSLHIAKCDAKRLYETGEGKGGATATVDEAVVLEILSKRSVAQLSLTFSTYTAIYGHTYTKFLKKVDCGGIGDAVRSVAKCICNPSRYYAKVLYGWVKGKTSDEGAIVRVMGAGTDMEEIETQLKKKYGVDLNSMICQTQSQTIAQNNTDLLLAVAVAVAANTSNSA